MHAEAMTPIPVTPTIPPQTDVDGPGTNGDVDRMDPRSLHSAGPQHGSDQPSPTSSDGHEDADAAVAMTAPAPVVLNKFRVLNDRLVTLDPVRFDSTSRTFPKFSSLPCELRLKIWRSVLERRRFIRMHSTWGTYGTPASTLGSKSNASAYTVRNALGNLVSGQLYQVHPGPRDGWESRRFPSALFAVNAEARQIALEFYYVKLPAADKERYAAGTPTIYLNPEWDYVRLFGKCPTDPIDFLWDIRAHDPKNRGLLHWMVTPHSVRQLVKYDGRNLKGLETPGHAALKDLVRGLQTVVFSHRDLDQTRSHLADGIEPSYRRHLLQPVFARPAEFELLDADPRAGVADQMSRLWVSGNPRVAAADLHLLFNRLHPGRHDFETNGPEIQHMVCVRPEWRRYRDGSKVDWVADREDFEDLCLIDSIRMEEPESSEQDDDEDDDEEDEEGQEEEGEGEGTSEEDIILEIPDAEDVDLHLPEDGNDAVTAHVPGVGGSPNEPDEYQQETMSSTDADDSESIERVAGFWLLSTNAFTSLTASNSLIDVTLWDVSSTTCSPQLGVFRLPKKTRIR